MAERYGPKHLAIILLVLGIIPAVIIVVFLRLQDGQLVVGGTELGEYSSARLLAGLISTALPLFILLPLSVLASRQKNLTLPALCAVAPVILFLPALLASLMIGGSGFGPGLVAIFSLCLLSACFTCWAMFLGRFLTPVIAVPVYGSLWASAQFITYLAEYVLPYLELKALGLVNILIWIAPQMQGGPNHVNEYLEGGSIPFAGFGPTFLQLVALCVILFFGYRHKKDVSVPADSQ